jgi:flavin-dependent dehydrogenase
MEFNIIPKGYLWIFPKKKHLCIGAYTSDYKSTNARQFLEDYLKYLGFNDYDPSTIKGHLIPHYGIYYKQPTMPCILVGDAAGFSDLWVGEGIFYAIKSGQIAAEIISESIKRKRFLHKELQKRYKKGIIRGLKIGYFIGSAYYNNMPTSFHILFNRIVLRIFFFSTFKGMTFDKIIWTSPVLLIRSLFHKINIDKNSNLTQSK